MLDGERKLFAVTAEVEVRVTPSVKFARAAQRLASTHLPAAFTSVMHEDDGEMKAALELAQVGEQRRDVAREVLVDAVQAYERIEDEQLGFERRDGLGEGVAVALEIDPDGRRGDHVDVEVRELAPGRSRDAGESLADDVECVLGSVEQYAPGLPRRESAETRHATSDRHGHVEREKRLAALRFAADDADGLVAPELVDEPPPIRRTLVQVCGASDGQCCGCGHRRAGGLSRTSVGFGRGACGRCSAPVISR